MADNCELLDMVIDAHGGLKKWSSVRELIIRARTGGIALSLRFQPV
jgi:hypothetical protein